jgi:hypothetical protein
MIVPGPMAERFNARAVHRSLSWFESSRASSLRWLRQLRLGKPYRGEGCRAVAERRRALLSPLRLGKPIPSLIPGYDTAEPNAG